MKRGARLRAAWNRLGPSERVVLVAWLIIGLQLVLRTWAAGGSWFYSDDFIFLGTQARGEADHEWFFTPHNIHLMPFGLWFSTLVGAVGTFAWGAAVTQMIALQALASLTFWWLLRTLFGDRVEILLPLALYAFLPMSMPTLVWWAAALNQLPHQIALFGALAAHVGYLRTRKPTSLILASAFLVFGFAAYTKTLLLPFLIVAVTLLYFTTGGPWRRLKRGILDFWPAWLSYGTVTSIYVAIYLSTVPRSAVPPIAEVLRALDLSLVEGLVPALLGGPWVWDDLDQLGGVGPRQFVGTPLVLVAMAWFVLGGLVLYLVLRRRRAWWPLMILLPYAAGSALLVAAGRAGAFGTQSAALELRYHAEIGGVAAVCLALAFLPVRGALTTPEPRTPAVLARVAPRRWVLIAMVVVLAGSLLSTVQYVRPWHDPDRMPQIDWVTTASTALTEEQVPLADVGVPDSVLWSAGFPANLYSHLLAPLGDRLDAADHGTDLRVLDAQGRPALASIVGSPRSEAGPVAGCGWSVGSEDTVIPIAPVIDFTFWMTINYVATADGTMVVAAGDNERTIDVRQGAHTAFLVTYGAYDQVTVRTDAGVRLCVDNINVGDLGAVASTPTADEGEVQP